MNRIALGFLLLSLTAPAFGEGFPYCAANYPYRSAPWSVSSATCYLVNSSVTSVGGSCSTGTCATPVQPGMHQNLLCRVTFTNGDTGEEVTVDMPFGYGGLNDDYSGCNLGGHGIDGTRPIAPGDFWRVLDRLCQSQRAIDTAISQRLVCYYVLGDGGFAQICKDIGSACTLQTGDLGLPTFNCRTIACYLWGQVPAPRPTPVLRPPTHIAHDAVENTRDDAKAICWAYCERVSSNPADFNACMEDCLRNGPPR